MSQHRYHGRRALLNGPGYGTTAAIVAEVEDTSGWREGKNGRGRKLGDGYTAEPAVIFTIANCDRAITFDLPFETAADRRNSMRKVETMIDVLSKFRDGLRIEHAAYATRVRGLKRDPEE